MLTMCPRTADVYSYGPHKLKITAIMTQNSVFDSYALRHLWLIWGHMIRKCDNFWKIAPKRWLHFLIALIHHTFLYNNDYLTWNEIKYLFIMKSKKKRKIVVSITWKWNSSMAIKNKNEIAYKNSIADMVTGLPAIKIENKYFLSNVSTFTCLYTLALRVVLIDFIKRRTWFDYGACTTCIMIQNIVRWFYVQYEYRTRNIIIASTPLTIYLYEFTNTSIQS